MDKQELKPEDTCREVLGETLHGGVRTILYFFDENGTPCLEKGSKQLLAVEFDKDGHEVLTTHGSR